MHVWRLKENVIKHCFYSRGADKYTMKIIEIIRENWITNQQMGLGSERPADQSVMELGGDKPHLLGKLEKTGQVVRILKRVKHVQFSDQTDWLLIDLDLTEKGKELKWLPGTTKFSWVKEFSREEIENENTGDSIGMGPHPAPWGPSPVGNYPIKQQ